MVHDPVEASEFLPRLQPGAKKIEDTGTAALPAVRALAKDANAAMVQAMNVGHCGRGSRAYFRQRSGEKELTARVAIETDDKRILWEQDGLRWYMEQRVLECIVGCGLKPIPACAVPYWIDSGNRQGAAQGCLLPVSK